MRLLEFKKVLHSFIPTHIYSLLVKVYNKNFRSIIEKQIILYRIKRNCDVTFAKKLLSQGVQFPHPLGIVINHDAIIGNNVIIHHHVTIGQKNGFNPIIQDNVEIYAHSIIFGKIIIGRGSIIGAGSVVTHSIPKNEIWAGNPAKKIGEKK